VGHERGGSNRVHYPDMPRCHRCRFAGRLCHSRLSWATDDRSGAV